MPTVLCFSITLGIMVFLPRPVESLPESKEAGLPFSPASFKAGSFFDEERPPSFHPFDPHKGLTPYDVMGGFLDETLSPARTGTLVSRAPQKSPRPWQSFPTQGLGNSTDGPMDIKTMINGTDKPAKPASVDVQSGRRQEADTLYLNIFSARSPSETGNQSPPVLLSMPSWPSTVPKSMYGARSATMHHDRASLYTPKIYTDPGAHSFSAALTENHQPRHVYPDVVHTTSPHAYSFHSATASIYSKWATSPPHTHPPPALTPGVAVAHSNNFVRLQDPPSTYRARTTSEPNASVRNLASRSHTLPATESSFQRRGSDGQVVDHAQWRRLVLGAAAKP